MTGNRDQAEDLFQETFKRVHEKAHTFRGGGFKSWLFTIATRLTIDGVRRNKRQVTISQYPRTDCGEEEDSQLTAVADQKASSPAEELVRQEQKEQVRKAIDSLPPGQRSTLVLAYYQQLSYREVAEVLGCSVGSVKTQMSRALATLARQLPDSIGATK
jgi:RNA polymerase sigma-70 factor (ECF subfamily)